MWQASCPVQVEFDMMHKENWLVLLLLTYLIQSASAFLAGGHSPASQTPLKCAQHHLQAYMMITADLL